MDNTAAFELYHQALKKRAQAEKEAQRALQHLYTKNPHAAFAIGETHYQVRVRAGKLYLHKLRKPIHDPRQTNFNF